MSGTVNNSQNLYFDFQSDQLERRLAALEKDNAALLAELARQRANTEERRRVLEGLEWADFRSIPGVGIICLCCGNQKEAGHQVDCPLAAALR